MVKAKELNVMNSALNSFKPTATFNNVQTSNFPPVVSYPLSLQQDQQLQQQLNWTQNISNSLLTKPKIITDVSSSLYLQQLPINSLTNNTINSINNIKSLPVSNSFTNIPIAQQRNNFVLQSIPIEQNITPQMLLERRQQQLLLQQRLQLQQTQQQHHQQLYQQREVCVDTLNSNNITVINDNHASKINDNDFKVI